MTRSFRPTRVLRALVCAGASLALLAGAAAPAAAGPDARDRRHHREGGIRMDRHGPPIRMAHREHRRHERWKERRHERHHERWKDRREHHRREHHRREHGHPDRHRGHGWGHAKHHRDGRHAHHRARHERRHHGWLCRPCGHRFASAHRFHRHLRHHHEVPRHLIPHVVLKVDLGWIFAG